MKLLSLLIIWASSVCAEEGAFYTKKVYEDLPKSSETKVKEIKIEFKNMKGIEVNDKCFKNKTCKALEALASKEIVAKVASVVGKKLIGDPASQTCIEHAGKNLILTGSDNKEYDFCELSDGSIFNSWQFYYSKFPNKNVVE